MSKSAKLFRALVVSCLLIITMVVPAEQTFAAQRGRGCRRSCERSLEYCRRHRGRACEAKYNRCLRSCR